MAAERLNTWQTAPLKRFCRISYGLGQPPKLSEAGVPILRATNIDRGRIDSTGLIYARVEDLPINRAPLLSEGEILVVRSGAHTGDSARISCDWVGAAPGYDLRLTPTLADSRFLAYVLRTTHFADQINVVKNRAAQPHLNAEELGDMNIPAPPLGVQQLIASFLDAETTRIDALIAKKRRLIKLVGQRYRAQVDALTGCGPTVPVRRVSQSITSGPRGWSDHVGEIGAPFIRSANLRRDDTALRAENVVFVDIVDATVEATRSRVNTGDTVVGITGANTGWVGLVENDFDGGYISQHVARIRPKDVVPEWLTFSIFSQRAQQQLLGGQYGGTKQQLGLEDLASLIIHVPSSDDQITSVRLLHQARSKSARLLECLHHQIELLGERRQALITAAVTGEMEVPGVSR